MSDDKRYNGWANYETWAVKLWMDNEESSQTYWQERTREAFEQAQEEDAFYEGETATDRARRALAQALKDEHEEAAPDLGATVWGDLFNAAMSEVDWYEIAAALLQDNEEEAANE